jgi:N-acetylglutamate synthase-like GNAT family acetyltransferase
MTGGLAFQGAHDNSDLQQLERLIDQFNIQATDITDVKLFALFLRDEANAVIGGLNGWSWGRTFFVQHVFVPANLRQLGHGTRLMTAAESEAKTCGCAQIVLHTHSFQAPGFYKKLGFEVAGVVPNYPNGHQFLTFVKRL